jgi:hypothetical protein
MFEPVGQRAGLGPCSQTDVAFNGVGVIVEDPRFADLVKRVGVAR